VANVYPAGHELPNRTSLEIIGRSGIGYSFDPMTPGQVLEDKYAVTLKELLGVSAHHAASIFIQTD
jgi:hypothetical protein